MQTTSYHHRRARQGQEQRISNVAGELRELVDYICRVCVQVGILVQ